MTLGLSSSQTAQDIQMQWSGSTNSSDQTHHGSPWNRDCIDPALTYQDLIRQQLKPYQNTAATLLSCSPVQPIVEMEAAESFDLQEELDVTRFGCPLVRGKVMAHFVPRLATLKEYEFVRPWIDEEAD